MKLHVIDCVTIQCGYEVYSAAKAHGPETGFQHIPGAILAAIADGLVTREEIVRTVARYTRTSRRAVGMVLDKLSAPSRSRLWARDADGVYKVVPGCDDDISLMEC